jgi:putative membrane protein
VVAPPLLALGAPSTLLLQTASRRTKERWLRILRSPAAAVITHPITVWCLYFGLMFAFFLSSLINVAMHHMALMDLLNLLFLFGGTLYWWPMVGLDPILHWRMGHGARMVNILLGGPPEVILGLAILSLRVPIASMYTLSSTHAGGALLWISTEFVVIAAFMPIFWQWMRSDERAAARQDARLAPTPGPVQTPAPEPSASSAAGKPRPAAVPRPAPATPAAEPAATAAPRAMTLWEAAWLARTGRIPMAGAPGNWSAGGSQPAETGDD